ncbi:serine/threonine protein kinase [Bacillus sp. FJAT-29790]|uniref:protein kinase domain-containing protein n=1 Tax=Bacillus sp. FJAT-29790 TaxID=1895002 RepID=UPI001C219255|nr:protein kinase [Bacillus sp. FJAT-29790]MBU8878507.1 serine/threonine protein kinase [Bacillus sp. FJAT-29790]
MADYDHLCLGCMGEKGSESVCPHCGWVEGTPAEAPQHLPPGTILHEKYLLGRVLGHGGFGITYLAWDMNLDMKLAIKEYMPRDFATRAPEQTMVSVFSGGLDTHFEHGLKNFLDEAKTLAQFNNHPGIVGVRDFFRQNGTAYLVMYYLEGIDFKQYLATQGGKIPFQAALSIMMPVIDALREVHRTGTLHRDISPDNIYITAEGQVKVLDFGAARHAISEFSKSISVILKPGYAPEEQYRSKGKQGPWTDVYATAATLYRAIVGHVPPESLDRLEEDSIVPPSKLGVEIPEKAEAALMKALAVKAADRYQSMEAFQQDLFTNTDLSVEPIEAVSSSAAIAPDPKTKAVKNKQAPIDPPKKKAISKWVWIGGGVAVAIFLTVGLIGTLFILGLSADEEPAKPATNVNLADQPQKKNTGNIQKTVKQVTVPKVINTREDDVKLLLENEGLKLGEITYVESIYAKKGVVMNQSLKPDDKANENDAINLEVSKGIELPFDKETIKAKGLDLVNEYWDKGYELDGNSDTEGALKYYLQARDMASVLYFSSIGHPDVLYSLGLLEYNTAIRKLDLGYYEYALHDIRNSVLWLEDFLEEDEDFRKDPVQLAVSYGEQSYIQLLNNMPEEAAKSAVKALEIDPDNIMYQINVAHAHLLLGDYDYAEDIYGELMNEKVNDNQTVKEFVLEDFKYFRKINITHPDMEKIEKIYTDSNAAMYSDEDEVEITIYANGIAFEEEDVKGYMMTIDPNTPDYAGAEKDVTAFFANFDKIEVTIDSIDVLEVNGNTAKAKVVQSLTYSDSTQGYVSNSTLIHYLVRSDGLYKWLITRTEVKGG